MTEYTNGMNGDSPRELERMTTRIAGDTEIHDLIGTTVHKTVSQYHSLLRKGLEQEVERILHEFTSATSDIELIVTKRVKSRLHEIVREEVQRIFDAALSATNESIFGPIETPVSLDEPESVETPVHHAEEEPARRTNQASIESGVNDDVLQEDLEDEFTPDNRDSVLEDETSTAEPTDEPDDHHEKPSATHEEFSSPLPVNHQRYDDPDDEDDDDDEELPDWNPVNLNTQASYDVEHAHETVVEPDADEEKYEGTVRLNVEANDCIGEVVHFVRELRQKPQLRLLRMVGNNKDGVDIWLGLREPLQLRKMLPGIEGVSAVSAADEEDPAKERVLSVRLEPRVPEESAVPSEV
jgi:hypothetical protein